MKQKLCLIRGDKQVRITTNEAYNHQTQEYVKIASSLIKQIYNNLVESLSMYELSQRHGKKETNNDQLSIRIKPTLFSKILFLENNKIYFDKVNPMIFERDFIMEMYIVGTNDLPNLLKNCKTTNFHSFQEVIKAIRKLAPMVIAIYDSSDVYIYFSDESLLEKALSGLGENFIVI